MFPESCSNNILAKFDSNKDLFEEASKSWVAK